MSASLIRSRAMVTHAIDRHRWNEVTDGAVLQEDGTIVELGTYQELSRKHPNVAVVGQRFDVDRLVQGLPPSSRPDPARRWLLGGDRTYPGHLGKILAANSLMKMTKVSLGHRRRHRGSSSIKAQRHNSSFLTRR
jgi:hypothetical protein